MKSVLSTLLILLIAFSVKAQNIGLTSLKTTWGQYEASGATFDTLKTSAAVYLYTGPLWGVKDKTDITAISTEISGTTAGTITLEASQDGTTWGPYYDSKDSVYSKTLTDVTTAQVYRWDLTNSSDTYYRIKWVGSGTVSVTLTGTYRAYAKRNN